MHLSAGWLQRVRGGSGMVIKKAESMKTRGSEEKDGKRTATLKA